MGKSLKGVNWKFVSIVVLSDELRPFGKNGEIGKYCFMIRVFKAARLSAARPFHLFKSQWPF